MKMTIRFEFESRSPRTIVVEGNSEDVAKSIAMLYAEFERYLPDDFAADETEHYMPKEDAEDCGHSDLQHEIMAEMADDPEINSVMDKMNKLMAERYGPDVTKRLERRLDSAVDSAAEEFLSAVNLGEKSGRDIVPFVLARIRAEFLSEIPDFPEALLDEAMRGADKLLRQQFLKMGMEGLL